MQNYQEYKNYHSSQNLHQNIRSNLNDSPIPQRRDKPHDFQINDIPITYKTITEDLPTNTQPKNMRNTPLSFNSSAQFKPKLRKAHRPVSRNANDSVKIEEEKKSKDTSKNKL